MTDFMINCHGSYVGKLGIELATPRSAITHATNSSVEPATTVTSAVGSFNPFSLETPIQLLDKS